MKTVKIILSLVLLFAITGGCSKDENEYPFSYEEFILPQLQGMNMPRPADSWNYPVYPGMPEWAQFKTGQEMVDACQVPEKRLKKMSTQAVIQAIWEYPLNFGIILLGGTYQGGFESAFLKNNAYKELIKRIDAGKSLLERLLLVEPFMSEAMHMPHVLELLISQTVFLSRLNNKEKKTIVEITLKNDSVRQHEPTTSNPIRGVSGLLMGRTMLKAAYLPFTEETGKNEQFETFLKTSYSFTFMQEEEEEFMQRIIFHGKNFIK
jgi:hypothetical protein